MATIRLIPSAYTLSSTQYLSVTDDSNMYANTDSTTYATVYNSRTSTTSYYIYVNGFNFDDIPSTAVVDSFTIKLKASESGVSTSDSYKPYLANGTTAINGSCDAITDTVSTYTFTGITADWETISDYGDDFGIRINCRRASRNTAGYVYIYGAEIEVNYTIPTYHTVAATSHVQSIEVSPSTQQVLEHEDASVYFYTDDISNYTVTDNGEDVTALLSKEQIPSGGTKSTNLGTYTLVSGGFNGQGATYFSGLVGKGESSSQTTSNYYSSGSGTIAVFTYDVPFTDIPANATITNVYVNVNGHAESTSNSNEYMCVQLISGNTELSEELNFKSIGTSNTTQTVTCTTIPTLSQLASLQVKCRLGYYGGAINGATVYVEYTTPSSGYYYIYTIEQIDDDHVILLEELQPFIPPEEDPTKTYYPITISSINATTDPLQGTTRVEQGTNQVVTIYPDDPLLTLALDNGVDISSQLVGGQPVNTYEVSLKAPNASYGFSLNSSSGYYVSTNNGISKSASVARLEMDFESSCLVTITYINYAEENYDYGMFGKLDTTVATDGLTAGSGSSSPSDSTSNYQLAKCSNSSSTQTITYEVPAGQHYIDIKYGKDDATDANNDSLQWKVTSVEATSGGGSYTYTLNNINQKHSLVFVFGNVSYYFVTTSGDCKLFPDGQSVQLPGDLFRLNIVPNNISDSISLVDNNVDKTSSLEKLEGTDKSGNPVVSYVYQIDNVQTTHTIVVSSSGLSKIFIKVNANWTEYSKIYKKINNTWVEQDIDTRVFDSGVNYKWNT